MPIELLDISISKKTSKPVKSAPKVDHLVRHFEDGSVEVADARGRRRRLYSQYCPVCQQNRPSSLFNVAPSHADLSPGYCCRPCMIERAQEMAAERARQLQQHRRMMLEMGETPQKRRAATMLLASPAWRDREAIKAIYAEARRLSQETGKAYDVDHIHPVMGVLSTGLHVHWNLQILEASVNRSKSDSFNLDESPAWGDVTPMQFREEYFRMYNEFVEREKSTKAAA